MTAKLYSEWHHLDFRPPSDSEDSTNYRSLKFILDTIGLNLSDFENKSSSTTSSYYTEMTYKRLIDIQFKEVGGENPHQKLIWIVFHGDSFLGLKLDIGKLLSVVEEHGFVVGEAHSRTLIPNSFVEWDKIDRYFLAEAYVSEAKAVAPIVDPSNGYAKSWYVGKRPSGRSQKSQGKRVSFYQADKIHPELPAGTTTMELQLFGYTAHQFVYGAITRQVDLTLKTIGVIKSYLDVITLPGRDKNKSRRKDKHKSASWWLKIVDNLPAIQLPRLDKTAPNLSRQIAAFKISLYSAKQKLGNDLFVQHFHQFCAEKGVDSTPLF